MHCSGSCHEACLLLLMMASSSACLFRPPTLVSQVQVLQLAQLEQRVQQAAAGGLVHPQGQVPQLRGARNGLQVCGLSRTTKSVHGGLLWQCLGSCVHLEAKQVK